MARFPRFKNARPPSSTINLGEALFIPEGWWHAVMALDVSISLTFTNFMHQNKVTWRHPDIGFWSPKDGVDRERYLHPIISQLPHDDLSVLARGGDIAANSELESARQSVARRGQLGHVAPLRKQGTAGWDE